MYYVTMMYIYIRLPKSSSESELDRELRAGESTHVFK
jgi:hypothetical protein